MGVTFIYTQEKNVIIHLNYFCTRLGPKFNQYVTFSDKYPNIYNSVSVRRHKQINSSVRAPLNATKIAVMKDIHWRARMVGPEFSFSCSIDL